MKQVEWRPVPGVQDYRVGFTKPCWGRYGWGCGHRGYDDDCLHKDHEDHGHIHLSDGEGEGRVPFCCYSRTGVAAILEVLVQQGVIHNKERCAVLRLPEVQALPRQLTAQEKEVLRSVEKREHSTKFFFIG